MFRISVFPLHFFCSPAAFCPWLRRKRRPHRPLSSRPQQPFMAALTIQPEPSR
jgi:hypothetical protein